MNNEVISILNLMLIPEIGPIRFKKLIKYFGSPSKVFSAKKEDLLSIEGISKSIATKIIQAPVIYKDKVFNEIKLAQRLGINIFTYLDDEYPSVLKDIIDSPPLIYVKGDLKPSDFFGIAVVGTRHPTPYGISVASSFSKAFVKYGITTISGLARGIDSEVHRVSVENGGRTIAVLGNGLNRHYPYENRNLEEKIVKNGALISEFLLDTNPDRVNFPRRNRLISAFGLATLVIEAGIKSGALITARYAAEQGKDVFAVPGSITSKYSEGPHYLIKSGAKLVESPEDVISELKPLCERLNTTTTLSCTNSKKDITYEKENNILLNSMLDKKESMLLDLIGKYPYGISIDEITLITKDSSSSLLQSLLNLELKGYIRSLPGKIFIKT